MTQAVILAGGKGTRLRERLGDLPKPLVNICGKPLLERQIELLKRYGYSRVLILVNHAAQRVVDFCVAREHWGLEIECINDGEPRGTAGALLAVMDRLDEEFLVVYGDTMLEVDLQRFQAYHYASRDVDATLFLHPNDHPQDSDLVEIDDDGRILGFYPYPHDPQRYYPNLVNAALYYMRRSALEPWREAPEMLDFGKDVFPAMLSRGCFLLGYNSPEYIKDCGTPARLDRICEHLSMGKVVRASLDVKQQAVFIDRDGTINREVTHLSKQEQFELLPGVSEAIKRLNASEYRTVVVTNQPVVARGDCTSRGLREIHNKMETLLGLAGAYIDRIYVCPHHPDKGYAGEVAELKVDCDCRKPKTGLVYRAKEDLNIDLASSWFVGDTSVDILTAQRAGVKSLLVETGYAGLDRRHWVTPDFIVPDLYTAVGFILDEYPKMQMRCRSLATSIGKGDIVFLGGLSRAGKSNFASCLRETLREQGQSATVLAVDRWLRNDEERGEGVLGRYSLNELRELIKRLSERSDHVESPVPAYDKVFRKRIVGAERLSIGPDDVLIVEGTIALSLMDAAVSRTTHGWFVEIDETERRRRVLREYILRGLSAEEAEAVYHSRQRDECPVIIKSYEYASRCITLASVPEVRHCSAALGSDEKHDY